MNIPKYRAWHKKHKKMYRVKGWMQGDSEQGLCVYAVDEHGVTERIADGLAELMEWTGHTDSNGTEIYQGDIIEAVNCWSEKHHAYITWDKVNPYYQWMIGETWVLNFLDGYAKGGNAPLYPYTQQWSGLNVTIIGNVWEHPHLLEQPACSN